MATIGGGGNYFSQVNAQHTRDLQRGDSPTAQNLMNKSGVTHQMKKSTVKKGGNISEEGANLSPAAREQLKTEAQQHADHTAEHGHELAQQAGLETDYETPDEHELRQKRGYDRDQELLADGPTPDGRVKVTSPEGETQILTVEDHNYLTKMDDPDETDRRLLDDIPEANLNAANATLDTQMAQGVSKVAVLKSNPKVDELAEVMEVQPLPTLVEPMDITAPGNDKITKPMEMEFPPEMERVAAEKAASELRDGTLQQEEFLAGPGMTASVVGKEATAQAGPTIEVKEAPGVGPTVEVQEPAAEVKAEPPKVETGTTGIKTSLLKEKATTAELDQFSEPMRKTQMEEARSQLTDEQKKDLGQLEKDMTRVRSLLKDMEARPNDRMFMTKSQQELQQCYERVGTIAQRYQNADGNMRVIIDNNNRGEVYTSLSWTKDKVTPEMEAQGFTGVAYNMMSSPGRSDYELSAVPLDKNGEPGAAYMKYRVANGDANNWQGVAAVVGGPQGETGFHACTMRPNDNTLYTQLKPDADKITDQQRALANQAMADIGGSWPEGATEGGKAHQNKKGQPQEPVQRGFIDRLRYAFGGGDEPQQSQWGGTPNYWGGVPNYWMPPQPNYMNYMNPYPSYGYPPVQYGGYPGVVPGWGGGGGGMNTMMNIMMATSMLSMVAMPLSMFCTSMFW